MYIHHFGLSGEPFALTPDPAFLFLSAGHAEALAALKIGLTGRRGLVLMTGEVGTGKTTLLYSLLGQLGPEVHSAYVSNTRLAFDDMLRQALADFGSPSESRDRVELLTCLNVFLQRCAKDGAIAALVIDEAQNLDDDTFENIRLLSNFESFTAKLLQIILVGQPELEAKLRRPQLRQVAERVAVHCHVSPLTRQESRRYIAHRLERVGGTLALFTRPALRLVVRRARGIPRRMNILCHNSLLFAYGQGAERVVRARVRAAASDWTARGLAHDRRGQSAAADSTRRRLSLPLAAGASLCIAAGLLALIAGNVRPPRPVERATIAAPQLAMAASSAVAPDPRRHAGEAAPLAAERDGNQAEEQVALARAPVPEIEVSVAAPPQLPPTLNQESSDDSAGWLAPSAEPDAEPDAGVRVIRVTPGTTLAALTKAAYGEVSPELLRRVQAANPQIADPNRILAGDALRFPELRAQRR
ncbi:MAG: AAA family ATPase [Deltaproteobacteria bacterium]|nr:AAA family ATPase [Deltaproteobacteria bacterium]